MIRDINSADKVVSDLVSSVLEMYERESQAYIGVLTSVAERLQKLGLRRNELKPKGFFSTIGYDKSISKIQKMITREEKPMIPDFYRYFFSLPRFSNERVALFPRKQALPNIPEASCDILLGALRIEGKLRELQTTRENLSYYNPEGHYYFFFENPGINTAKELLSETREYLGNEEFEVLATTLRDFAD